MVSKLFLFNETVLSLAMDSDPRLSPDFPLSKEQFDGLSADDFMNLLREEYRNDPDMVHHQPKTLLTLCALLHAKGGINCVKAHWDGYGVSSRHGAVPETSLALLHSMEAEGKLTQTVVEETVWSKLNVA